MGVAKIYFKVLLRFCTVSCLDYFVRLMSVDLILYNDNVDIADEYSIEKEFDT